MAPLGFNIPGLDLSEATSCETGYFRPGGLGGHKGPLPPIRDVANSDMYRPKTRGSLEPSFGNYPSQTEGYTSRDYGNQGFTFVLPIHFPPGHTLPAPPQPYNTNNLPGPS